MTVLGPVSRLFLFAFGFMLLVVIPPHTQRSERDPSLRRTARFSPSPVITVPSGMVSRISTFWVVSSTVR